MLEKHFVEDLFLGGQWSIILGYRRLSVKSLQVLLLIPWLICYLIFIFLLREKEDFWKSSFLMNYYYKNAGFIILLTSIFILFYLLY